MYVGGKFFVLLAVLAIAPEEDYHRLLFIESDMEFWQLVSLYNGYQIAAEVLLRLGLARFRVELVQTDLPPEFVAAVLCGQVVEPTLKALG